MFITLRGDKEADQNRAEVADEEVEQSKHFDEESGPGNPDKKMSAETSKSGDNSKHDFASTSVGEMNDIGSKNTETETETETKTRKVFFLDALRPIPSFSDSAINFLGGFSRVIRLEKNGISVMDGQHRNYSPQMNATSIVGRFYGCPLEDYLVVISEQLYDSIKISTTIVLTGLCQ
ncbi:hypothetical protein RJ639_006164 [Escallonia herrerae]|uniref:Uncharacterized protein n=1 Tax=Escallonia herrerae TaxID=1293975 RepID=A0AA89AXT1_9ASTE|nr:hypothetical protein RJ639_006164 [Escallonia herrerae]